MIEQMSNVRFVQVYIVQGLVFLFFLFIAYRILKHNKKRINYYFCGWYLGVAIANIFNFIYAPLTDELIVFSLNFITNFLILFSSIFIVVFEIYFLSNLKEERKFSTKNQYLIISIYGILCFCMILIPNGVTINENTNWKPVYTLPFFIYIFSLLTFIIFIPLLYFSFQIFKEFKDDQLKKKWRYYIVGICFIYTLTVMTFFSNLLNNEGFRQVTAVVGLTFIVLGALFIYYGAISNLKRPKEIN